MGGRSRLARIALALLALGIMAGAINTPGDRGTDLFVAGITLGGALVVELMGGRRTQQIDAIWQSGFDRGYDKGWHEGRRSARPVVVPALRAQPLPERVDAG